ncbi:MAG: TonB-dependent receptor plug domain-containing protein [Bacteroidota bacterium]
MLQRTLAALFFLISLFGSFPNSLPAQDQESIQTDTIYLIQYLKQLEQKYTVSFSYNHTLLKEIKIFFLPTYSSLEACLDSIQSQTAIRFERVNEAQFLLIPIRQAAQFRVVEAGTGLPVYSLIVQVNDQPKTYLLPHSDQQYVIPELFPTDSVRFKSNFHVPLRTTAEALFSLEGPLQLTSRTVHLKEVIVQEYLTNGVAFRLQDHSIHIDMQKLGLLPGETDKDVLLLLKNLPGIRTPDGKPGSLTIRGSSLDQNLMLFDDIPIYHPGHFLGTISPYNPLVIDKVDVYRSTLPAKYGGRVGGLISLQTENPLEDSASVTAMSSTIYGGIKLKLPLIKDKLGLLLSARSSFPSNTFAPKLSAYTQLNYQGSRLDTVLLRPHEVVDPFRVRFRDVVGKLVYQINPQHQVSMSYLGIFNRNNFRLNDTIRGPQEEQVADLNNWGLTTKWSAKLSPRLQTHLSLTRSRLSLHNATRIFRRNGPIIHRGNESELVDTRLMAEANIQASSQLQLESGYHLFTQSLDNMLRNENGQFVPNRTDQASIHSVFASLKPQWARLSADIGLRLGYYEPISQLYVDPRLSTSVILNRSLIAKASAGQSHQNMQQRLTDDFDDFRLSNQYWFMPMSPRGVMEGRQAMIGALYEQAGWLVDVEIYTKNIQGLEREVNLAPQKSGSIHSRGTDVFVKKKWGAIESWLSYSYSHVQTKFEAIEEAMFNQPHIANVSGILHQGPWTLAISWGYMAGMPVEIPNIDPNHPNSNGLQELVVPYTDRFPAQHQLDISTTYSFRSKKNRWKAVIGAAVINAYNQLNYINIIQNNPLVSNPYRYGLGFTPDMHVSISF